MLLSLRPPGTSSAVELSVGPGGIWTLPERGGDPELGVGWWALPGLADAHAHLAADSLVIAAGEPAAIRHRAFACLDNGTFLVIDKGWGDDVVLATLTDLPPTERPDFQGAGGIIRVEGGYYPDFGRETDPAGLGKVVAEAAVEGRGWVKLIGDWPRKGQGPLANFDEAALALAVEVAHAGKARVAIHTMAPDVASMAARAGVDSIEHGLFLTADDLESLGARGGAWVPTVLAMEAVVAQLGAGSSGGRLISQGLDNVAALLRSVPDGLAVLAGTDLAVGSAEVAREVEALIRLGLDPVRAVRAASESVRSLAGLPAGFQVGQPADAVFFEGDPFEDPSVLGRPTAVMRAGVVRR